MPPILISVGKWLVTAVIVPIVEKWVAIYISAQKRIKEIGKKGEANEQSAENYDTNPNGDTFSKLP